MSNNMNNLTGWHQVTCEEREAIAYDKSLWVFSSLTDMTGEFGEPIIYTEWGRYDPERPVLRDYLWPKEGPRHCEHWIPDL